MKKVISLSLATLVLGLSSSALAAKAKVACPAGTQQTLKCLSTPLADGTEDMIGNFLDAILVCSTGERVLLVLEKGKKVLDSGEAEVIRRVGGSSYKIKTNEVDFMLSHGSLVGPAAKAGSIGARLSVSVKELGYTYSSTYTCKR
ncbi:hypothetical protein [Pseudobdellovibrio exovorus]|uniref:Uncharacterized protein n=1 Tax=Pseudobdellovibrio exovorus JSS TaxID=1184267 RepID=M4VDV3_9BACT|nr:hypothetical protein [Pseudobdellovibrio exovorus]AGH96670.1 hypothetical protein A11Q_2454 [Pseudobdellovibrio exovorus JSS]